MLKMPILKMVFAMVAMVVMVGCSPCTTRVASIGSYGYSVYDGAMTYKVEVYSSRVVDGVGDVLWSEIVYDKMIKVEDIPVGERNEIVELWKRRKADSAYVCDEMIIRREAYGNVAQVGQLVAFPVDVGINVVAITGWVIIGIPAMLIYEAIR